MATLPPLRNIVNGTPADASDVEYNFQTLEDHVNAELVNRDGSVPMTGPLVLPGSPTQGLQAATKAYVDGQIAGGIPVGVMMDFGGDVAPSGFALCNGASVSTTDPTYAALFAVIGYKFGGTGGSFNLPDRRSRVSVGVDAGDADFDTVGNTGGDKNLQSHKHTTDAHTHTVNHFHSAVHGHADTFTTGDDAHNHTVNTDPTVFAYDNNDTGNIVGTQSPVSMFWRALNSMNTGGDTHNHVINGSVSNYNGNTSTENPGSSSASPDTGWEGAGAGENLQPYLVVTHIIKL